MKRLTTNEEQNDMDTHYIGEIITVEFDRLPLFSKRPHCPDRFTWRGEAFAVAEVLSRRVDFGRRAEIVRLPGLKNPRG